MSELPFEPAARPGHPFRRKGPSAAIVRALDAVRRQFAAEAERWRLWAPVAFGVGIGLYFWLNAEPPWWGPLPIGAIPASLFALLWVVLRAGTIGGRRLPALRRVLLICALLSAGFAIAQARSVTVGTALYPKTNASVWLEGSVVRAEPHRRGQRLVLADPVVTGAAEAGDAGRAPRRVRVVVANSLGQAETGQRVRIRARISPPPWPPAPGAFDFQRHLYFQGIGAVGFAVSPLQIVSVETADLGWWARIDRVRSAATERILTALPDRRGAVAAALLTGERGAIPESVLVAMREAGLAHLLAISGLHLGLVAGLVFFAARAGLALIETAALRLPIKKIAALVALAAGFCYLLLAGAPIPTQRAYLMVGLVLVGVLFDRTAISMHLVAWAAGLVLVLAPEALLGPSFQLSFAAVVALVAAFEATRDRWRMAFAERDSGATPLARLGLYFLGVAATTVIAGGATALFAAHHFDRLATYGVVSNLVAVPLTAFWIMPLGVAAGLLMPIGLEAWALVPMGWGIEAVIRMAETASSWPSAVVHVKAMPKAALLALSFGGLWLCLWAKPWRWLGLVPGLVGAVLWWAAASPDILLSADAKLWAARDPGNGELVLSSRRAGKVTGEIWLRRNGQATSVPLRQVLERDADWLRCDDLGCIYRPDAQTTAALVRDPMALSEDCAMSDLVISAVPVRVVCAPSSGVIDRFDVWRHGPHAVWFDRGAGDRGIRIQSVGAWRGARPWTPVRPRFGAARSER